MDLTVHWWRRHVAERYTAVNSHVAVERLKSAFPLLGPDLIVAGWIKEGHYDNRQT